MLKFLQIIGKSLMLPIACLPIAGLMLRIGQPDIVEALSFIPLLATILPYFTAAGAALFDNLPLIFAVGVAVGISDDQNGAAGLSGVISYLTLVNVTQQYWVNNFTPDVYNVLDISFLGGILAGVIGGLCYNKYRNTKLPEFLAFFGGRRTVPIMSGILSLIVAIPLAIFWPYAQSGLANASIAISGMGALGIALYGFFNRLLIPIGLHHVLNTFFWFQLGEYQGATGDLYRFFAGDPSAGHFMALFFPVMMFGLPAVAAAIYFAAKKDKRKAVGGMLISLALTSFLTGITEPLEFLFIFLSPILLVAHAFLMALSGVLVSYFGILHGFTFSAGFIDYAINFNLATNPLLIIPVGLIIGALYFVVFYFLIIKLNLPTPGREEDNSFIEKPKTNNNYQELAEKYVEYLGGKENLIKVNNCTTRLRLEVNDKKLVNEQGLSSLGAKGIVHVGENGVQVIVGTKVEFVADSIKEYLKDLKEKEL